MVLPPGDSVDLRAKSKVKICCLYTERITMHYMTDFIKMIHNLKYKFDFSTEINLKIINLPGNAWVLFLLKE